MNLKEALIRGTTGTRTEERGEFTTGIERGIDQTQATGYGFVQTLAQTFGNEAVEAWAKDGVEKNLQEAARNPAKIQSYKDIENFADIGDYVMATLGEQVPNLAAMAGGGAAGVMGKAVLGKTIATQIAKRQAATAGMAAATFPLTTGETQLEMNEAGVKAPGTVLATGAIKTLLEVGPVGKLLDNIADVKSTASTVGELFKESAKVMYKQAGLEAATEGAQTLLDKTAVGMETDTEILSADNLDEILESMVKGGIVGGVMGGGSRLIKSSYDLYNSSQNDDITRMEMPPEVDKIVNQYLQETAMTVTNPTIEGEFIPGQKPLTPSEQQDAGITIDAEAKQIFDAFSQAGIPIPSSKKEINFSANAFLEGRQFGYIQTKGEPAPKQLLEDKTVQSVEITPEMTDDKQVIGGQLYFKNPQAIELLKQGSGVVQNYGVTEKPENATVGVVPIDKDGNHGSPVLANEETLEKVTRAQEQRAGRGGQLAFVPVDKLEGILQNRIKEEIARRNVDNMTADLPADMRGKIRRELLTMPLDKERQVIREESNGLGTALSRDEFQTSEIDENNQDLSFAGFQDGTLKAESVEINGVQKAIDPIRKRALHYGIRKGKKHANKYRINLIDADGNEIAFSAMHALSGRIGRDSGGYLDVARGMNSGAEQGVFSRALDGFYQALADIESDVLGKGYQIPATTLKQIENGRLPTIVAKIDGKELTLQDLQSAARKEKRITNNDKYNDAKPNIKDVMLSDKNADSEVSALTNKAKRDQQRFNLERELDDQERLENDELSFSESRDGVQDKRAEKTERQGLIDEKKDKFKKDTGAGPVRKDPTDPMDFLNKVLDSVKGLHFSKNISAKEQQFIKKMQKIFGDKSNLYVIDETDLARVISNFKNGGVNIPLNQLQTLQKDLTDNKTQGGFVPLGKFGIIVVKNHKRKGPKAEAQRLMVLAHEFGHVLYNSLMINANPSDVSMLRREFEKSKQDNFEEWFADQVAAFTRDNFTNKENQEKLNAVQKLAKRFFVGFKRIFQALDGLLPDRFTSNAKFQRYIRRAIKEGVFNEAQSMGFGEYKRFGDQAARFKEKWAVVKNSAFARRMGKEINKIIRTADTRLRKMGDNGAAIANIFSNRSSAADKTSGTFTTPVETFYTYGQEYQRGEKVYWNGALYRIKKKHTANANMELKDLLKEGYLAQIRRESMEKRVKNLGGWLNSRAAFQAKWVDTFKKILPENHEQYDEWLRTNVIEADTPHPEFKKAMDALWQYANARMGGRLGKIQNYMPRVYNPAAILDNVEGFKEILRNHLPAEEATDAKLDGIIQAIVAQDGVFTEDLLQDDIRKTPGMDNKKKRVLDIPESELQEFMADPSYRLFNYIHKTVSRAEYEMRAGGYDDVFKLEERLKRQARLGYVDPNYFDAIIKMADELREEKATLRSRLAEKREQLRKTKSAQAKQDLRGIIDDLESQLNKEPPKYWNPNGHLDELLEGLNESDQREARKIVEGMMGRLGIDISPEARKVQQWLMALQYYTTLAFATISSFTDLNNILIRGKVNNLKDFYNQSKIIKDAFKDRKNLEAIARAIGVVQHDTITSIINQQYGGTFTDPTVQKWNDRFFKAIGLEWYTRTTRIMSMSMAFHFIEEHGLNPTKHSKRYLKDLKLTQADVEAWVNKGKPKLMVENDGKLDPNDPVNKVISAVNQFVDESILRPNAAQRPTWGSDLGFFHQLVWQLKSYYWAFGHVIIEGVAREMQQRKKSGDSPVQVALPALFAALPLMGLAALGMEIKEFIKHGTFDGPNSDMSWPAYTFEVFDRAGGLGPASLLVGMWEAPKYGNSPIVSLLGPTAEHIETFFGRNQAGLDLAEGFERAIPYISQTNGKFLGYDISPF